MLRDDIVSFESAEGYLMCL